MPLFLMISGYLLLDRDYTDQKCKGFWKKNLLRLFICTEIWFTIYIIFLNIHDDQPFKLEYLIEELLFVRRVNMSHVWYMPMIIGMYILFPYVSKAIRSFDTKKLLFPIVIFTLYSFVAPFADDILQVYHYDPLSIELALGFSGGAYGIYFMIGYLVKKDFFKNLSIPCLMLITVVSFIITVSYQLWMYRHNTPYSVWYNNPILLICTASLFILISKLKKVYVYKAVYFISYFSFAVYLIHNIVKSIFIDRIRDMSCSLPLKVVILWCIIVAVSFPVAWIIKHIPKIGKYILYLK